MLRDLHTKTALLFLLGLVTALAVTAFVYWPGLSGPFMLDDGANIGAAYVANPDWEAFVYIVTHNGSGLLGRSVSMISFVLTGLQYGLEPWGYKYHNLLLHLLVGVALFRLLQVLLPKLDPGLGERKVLLVAGVTTSLWLLHPLLVSTVLYAVQRMTQLSALFTLLALLAYLKARSAEGTLRFVIFGWCVFPLMGLLAALSKENGALIPFYLLAIEAFVFKTGLAELRKSRRLALLVGPFVLLPLLAVVILVPLLFGSIADYGGRTFTLGGRLLTEVHVLFLYVQLIFLPRIRAMSLFQDDFPVTTSLDLATVALIALLIGIVVLAWKLRNSWAVLPFGVAWFLVSHLMESTIFPLELVFEHRNYLASAGLLLLPVYAVFRIAAAPLRLLCPVFVLMFAFMTLARANEWGNDDVFHRIAIEEHPNSGRALNTYANYLTKRGEYDEVVLQLERLGTLTPLEAGAFLHLQSIKCAIQTRDETALTRARELLGQYPASVYGYNSLQNLLMLVIDEKCPVVTIDEVAALVDTAVAYAEATDGTRRLPYLLRLRGIIAFYKGYYAQGYSDFRTAHELLGDITFLHELMRYQLERGEIADAEDTLALMEQQNQRNFGIDEHQLRSSRKMLDDARRGRELAVEEALKSSENAPAETGTQ